MRGATLLLPGDISPASQLTRNLFAMLDSNLTHRTTIYASRTGRSEPAGERLVRRAREKIVFALQSADGYFHFENALQALRAAENAQYDV